MQKIQHTIELLKNSEVFYTLIVNMSGQYEYVSKSYEEKFKFLGETLKGKPYEITLHPDDKELCMATGIAAINNPENLYKVALRKHDGVGGHIYTLWEYKAIMINNEITGVFCIGYNTTEYEATSAKLVNAEDIIQQNNFKLEEIGYTQSHMVRRPIANLLGLLETLDNSSDINDYKHIHELLKDSVVQLDNIVKKINDNIDLQ